MFEWATSLLSGAMAELMFLAICIGSAVITTFSLIFGGDHDADHGDVGGDHGDVGGHDVHHDDGDHSRDGPGFFSVRGLTLFGTGFGGVGYLVQHFTSRTLTAGASGLAAGVALAAVGLAFIRAFYHQQASSLVPSGAIVGAVGMVTTSIPRDGAGEAEFTVGGIHTTRLATSANGAAIERGKTVRVVRAASHAVVVELLAS